MCKYIRIFTDGSCLGNPGPGGYGIIIRYQQYEKILSAGYYLTTNNRMEIMAVIVALKCIKKNSNILLITDSFYIQKGITQWIYNWKKNNWKNNRKKKLKILIFGNT